MSPDLIAKLLEVLREGGVARYKDERIELELFPEEYIRQAPQDQSSAQDSYVYPPLDLDSGTLMEQTGLYSDGVVPSFTKPVKV